MVSYLVKRISNIVKEGSLFVSREKKTFPLVGRTCAFDAKILVFSEVRFWLSTYG